MIESKQDLKEYLKSDMESNEMTRFAKRVTSAKWKYFKTLRKTEYVVNCRSVGVFGKILVRLYRYKLYRQGLKTGWIIGPNCFGKGLILPHYGTIVVNGSARFGDNCVVQCGVNVSENVRGGNHIYMGAGSKIVSDIIISDDIIIGYNAVVTKSFNEPNVVLAGAPAKIISNNGYRNRTKI